MAVDQSFEVINKILKKIRLTQSENIRKAARVMADSIAQGGVIHLFGGGHSVIPVLDIFPRYGSYVGFRPLLDPRGGIPKTHNEEVFEAYRKMMKEREE